MGGESGITDGEPPRLAAGPNRQHGGRAAEIHPRRVERAMPADEWLRTQWIVRVAYGLGKTPVAEVPDWPRKVKYVLTALRRLEAEGRVERRDATERREGEAFGTPVAFDIPRSEWRRSA